jgi:glutamate-ammonia-ligase adenylyltransferase
MLQLQHASRRPEVLVQSTQAVIAALAGAGAIPADLANRLGEGYRFLRRVESGLRLLNSSARHDLPADRVQLAQLALLLGHGNPDRLRDLCREIMSNNRAVFDQLSDYA